MDFKAGLLSLFYFLYGYIQVSAEYSKSIDVPSTSNGPLANAKMRGWEIQNYSGIKGLQLSDNINVPAIKSKTDVLVEVIATSVNPLDQLMTAGYGRRVLNTLRWINNIKEFPLILGREFVGVVKAKGQKVRADIQVGDKVWGVVPLQMQGSFAEYVVVDQNTITLKPQGIEDIGAAGILFAGLTAWSSIFISGLAGGIHGATTSKGGGSGKRICILGASGGVGTLAVQIAKAENMKITATCGTDSVQMVRDLGADRVIDYRTENLTEAFRGQSYDIIFDSAGLGPDYATKFPWKFSKYITLQPPLLNNTDNHGLIFGSIKSVLTLVAQNIQTIYGYRGLMAWGVFVPAPQGIEYLRKLVEAGKMKPIIDTVYEFESTKEAFQKVADGHLRGKVIVKVKG